MSADSTPQNSPFIRWLLWRQFQVNCLWSVAIEYPALRDNPWLR